MKSWLTVQEAAVVVGRHASSVYRWIDNGILPHRVEGDGTIRVSSSEVTRVESVTRRGRPRGSARPRATRRNGLT